MRRFFTPSMAVACLALVVALSGTAYAVTRLPANSVGTKQVINHSLQRVDFKRGTLLRGPAGQRGPQGPAFSPGKLCTLEGRGDLADGRCRYRRDRHLPGRLDPVGGGYQANVPVYLMSELPESLGWHVRVRSTGATLEGGLPGSLYVYTECVKTSP